MNLAFLLLTTTQFLLIELDLRENKSYYRFVRAAYVY